MTIIDKQPNERPTVTVIPGDVPYPKGVLVGEYVVTREFIDQAYWFYQQEDAVREMEFCNSDLA